METSPSSKAPRHNTNTRVDKIERLIADIDERLERQISKLARGVAPSNEVSESWANLARTRRELVWSLQDGSGR